MMKKLTFILFLFTLALGVNAQSPVNISTINGGSPLVGGTYHYSVTMENNTNTGEWKLYNGTIDSGTDVSTSVTFDLTDKENPSISYPQNFAAGTYNLYFIENNGSCSSVRKLPITVSENNFDITVTGPNGENCNPENNKVHVSDDVADLKFVYTVTRTMVGGTWIFNLENTTTLESGSYVPTITVDKGTYNSTGNTVTVSGTDSDVESVNVTVTYSSVPLHVDVQNKFKVNSSTLGNTKLTLTAKNITGELDGTIKGLPNTSDITFK